MILYMNIGPGQLQITPDDKISKLIYTFCYFDHSFIYFHHDTPNSKETRGQKISTFAFGKCHNSVINCQNLLMNNPKRGICKI